MDINQDFPPFICIIQHYNIERIEEAMVDIREAMEGPANCTEREKIIPFLARFFSILDSNRDCLPAHWDLTGTWIL